MAILMLRDMRDLLGNDSMIAYLDKTPSSPDGRIRVKKSAVPVSGNHNQRIHSPQGG
jgi:hypothetical protein